jgi:hypothetical protein
MNTYEDALNFIKDKKEKTEHIKYEESFSLAILCSKLLRALPNEGRDLIIRIHDIWELLPNNTCNLWNDLTESAGLYPYVDPMRLSKSALIRYEYHTSNNLKDVVLHEEQMIISQILQDKKSVVASAPTSFGKSLLIEEIIASQIYKNIVIIQPTLALINETRKKLLKYDDIYNIVLATSQIPVESKNNIFIFTGERVVEYKYFSTVDFFVIDEFYKLSIERDDERAIALNQAFGKLLTLTNRFYLLAPVIKNISIDFREKFDFLWYSSHFATVAVDERNIPRKVKTKTQKKTELFRLLTNTTDQTIIYCSSPTRVNSLSLEFLNFLIERKENKRKIPDEINDLVEWISENIISNWYLIKALKNGIAIHHGGLPRHLGSTIVEYFNLSHVRWLFCTSTLIEGVNTAAKNVILFDKKKGTKPIDYFDYRNIAGRSGRMKQHFLGNVIKFEPEPEQVELDVDIPLFNQQNAPLEILINLKDDQIDSSAKSRLKEFVELPTDLQVMLKSNTGISIDGQKNIIKRIEENLSYYHNCLSWKNTPSSFAQMHTVIELCWSYLLGPSDRTYIPKIGRLSDKWLAGFAYTYVKTQSINAMIRQYINEDFWKGKIVDPQERCDIVTYAVLHIVRHWFDYKLPKWIMTISSIQEYVFKKHGFSYGNYAYTASNIENGFLHKNIGVLAEYGIPATALKKLGNIIDINKSVNDNLNLIKSIGRSRLESMGLLKYEIDKIAGNS